MRSHRTQIQRAKLHRGKLALFMLLAVQLVFGLQLPAPDAVAATAGATAVFAAAAATATGAASAATTTATGAASAATSQHTCTTHAHHGASDAAPLASHDVAAGDHGLTSDHSPTGGHTCCHTGSCQCQCLNPPAAVDFSLFAEMAASVAIPSLPAAQFHGPRIDEFLRPPIA